VEKAVIEVECEECGFIFPFNAKACPECGAPAELTHQKEIVPPAAQLSPAAWQRYLSRFAAFAEGKRTYRIKRQPEESREKLIYQINSQRVVVKTYRGDQVRVTRRFRADAARMATQGYVPTTQTWVPPRFGCVPYLIALCLCPFIIGIPILILLILTNRHGGLTVTYELRDARYI
jgi:hypothetical protein